KSVVFSVRPCLARQGLRVCGESSLDSMNKLIRRFGATFGMAALCSGSVLADVTVTEPNGGQNISADKAVNSTNGAAFTALGNIVITEGDATDFANGSGVTLILTPPYGWQFKPGAGNVLVTPGRNLSATSIAVAADSATVTFTASGVPSLDTLTISNLQVQAFDGAIDLFADPFI